MQLEQILLQTFGQSQQQKKKLKALQVMRLQLAHDFEPCRTCKHRHMLRKYFKQLHVSGKKGHSSAADLVAFTDAIA